MSDAPAVLVVVELRDGTPTRLTLELLGLARSIAGERCKRGQ